MISLRDYQTRGVKELRELFRRGKRSLLYVLPTGGGKTRVFTHITMSAGAKGKRVLILVHRQELLSQSSLSLGELGVTHGLITPDAKIKPVMNSHLRRLHRSFLDQGAHVQVASVQTISRSARLERWANKFDLIIVDEAHHATAGQWFTFLDSSPNSKILGVTATPKRSDGQGLGVDAGGVFEAMVVGPSPEELMEEGYLCRARVYAPPKLVDLSGIKRNAKTGDFSERALAEAMAKREIYGDSVKHYSKICPGAPAIAFCSSVKNAKLCAEEFRRGGWRAASIDGDMDDDTRRDLIEALGNGQLDVLASCDIISEGTDIPVVTTAIKLRPTDSEGLNTQQDGRVLRPIYAPGYDLSTKEGRLDAIAASDKPYAIVIDHVGNCIKHGLPDEERDHSLDGREKGTRESDDSSQPIRVMQCPKCFAAHAPADVCPSCGHVYSDDEKPKKPIDCDLEEITEAQAEQLRIKRRQELGMAATREELEKIAEERGYKPAWVRMMLKVRRRQGRIPSNDNEPAQKQGALEI